MYISQASPKMPDLAISMCCRFSCQQMQESQHWTSLRCVSRTLWSQTKLRVEPICLFPVLREDYVLSPGILLLARRFLIIHTFKYHSSGAV